MKQKNGFKTLTEMSGRILKYMGVKGMAGYSKGFLGVGDSTIQDLVGVLDKINSGVVSKDDWSNAVIKVWFRDHVINVTSSQFAA